MIELQIINKILKTKSISIVRKYNLTAKHFISYGPEFEFLMRHYDKYNLVPDIETFLAEFDGFDVLDVNEADTYLAETLFEEYTYAQAVPVVHKIADLLQTDANQAVSFLRQQSDYLYKLSTAFKQGYNIVKNSADRKAEFKFRLDAEGLLGISTGVDQLDTILHGFLKEDFIVVLGRTNEGKTWVVLFFLVAAWQAGVSILLYSGEMSKEMVGFRFDSLHGCFSNLALMSGSNQLGSLEQPKSADDYFDYLTDLSNNETPFIVVTPQDIGGRLTVPMLHALIEMYNPGFVGIDQISLMDDARSREGTQERIRLTNIAEDLYLATEKYKIPIIAPVQASKVSEKENKDEQGNVDAPKLEHAFGADGIVQNATRVIAIKKQGKTMKMVLRKNRYGLRDGEVLVLWDIDKGVVQPMLSVQKNEQGAVTGTKRAPAAKGVDLF